VFSKEEQNMSKIRFYGNVNNRIDENRMFVKEIREGTRLTRYDYSDTDAYEVIKAVSQEDVIVKALRGPCKGDCVMDSDKADRDIYSIDERAEEIELVKRYGRWYSKTVMTAEELNKPSSLVTPKERERIERKGFANRFGLWNVSFGVAQIYYDPEF
jgi:hypothetical protein